MPGPEGRGLRAPGAARPSRELIGGGARASRPRAPAEAPRGRGGGRRPRGVARAHVGRRRTRGCWEGWAVRETGGRGSGPQCACAPEPELREEVGAEEAVEGAGRIRRHVRSQRPLPQSTESPGSTARRGASGARNRPGLCQPRRPPRPFSVLTAPSARSRPPVAAHDPGGKSSREGRGRRPVFLPSSLSRSSVSSPAPHSLPLRAWLPGPGPIGDTERERGRGWTMLGAEGGSLVELPLSTCPWLLRHGLRLKTSLEAST